MELTQKFANAVKDHIKADWAVVPQAANKWELWNSLARTMIQEMAVDWYETQKLYKAGRQAHYFSAEFLVGRSTLNNLINRDMYDAAKEMFAQLGENLTDILEQENDAALGNGGLGRLAACFLDSATTLNLPVTGYGILYRYGLFKQIIEDGYQKEFPDEWMERGYPFIIRRDEERFMIRYNDLDVYAVAYDMPITGYGTKNVNTLKLWYAEPYEEFDFNLFNSQRFDDSVRERNRVEDICRVLYPNDSTYDGKVLRVRQQYFFVSASLQYIMREYVKVHGKDFAKFAEFNTMQLNDTHPVIAIPELIRLLMQNYNYDFNSAFDIAKQCFAYTNHTILAEALEKWDISIFQFLLPDILQIIYQINERFCQEMQAQGLRYETLQYLMPIHDGKVHMAWIACYMARSINGVAALHTDILRRETLNDWYKLYPGKFSNKTNGVTPRRWLNNLNPELSALLTEKYGSTEWISKLDKLSKLEKLADDKNLLQSLADIKLHNKRRLIAYIKAKYGTELDEDAIFDVQIKRLHEYKRQFLNALYIVDLYYRIKEDAQRAWPKVNFIFAAKSAPGYVRAKSIIKFINAVADLVNNDPEVNKFIKVFFVPNYNVSQAELLFPAADISEQISTVGMEASGTGNMKFMMNGAVTLGTHDGANIEIADSVGEDNVYFFGPLAKDMPATKAYYNSMWQYENIPGLKRAVDILTDGTLSDNNTGIFNELKNSLLHGSASDPADTFYLLGDFDDYRRARDKAFSEYADTMAWQKKAWVNICMSGRFSSDRTIAEYAKEIWHIEESKIDNVGEQEF